VLAPAIAALGRGELVMLYPEGGISDGDQSPQPAMTGAARLAPIEQLDPGSGQRFVTSRPDHR
jgi:1-acyl-sn-glycerol-3-phosphate acyltransferase